MKRWILRSLLLLLILLVFVLLRAPAKHAIAYASPHIAPTVISEPQGSVWQGQAAMAVHPQITLKNIAWDYRALASLFSGPGVSVSGNTNNGQFDLLAHVPWSQITQTGSVKLRDINAIVPLSDLPLPAIARSFPISGDVILRLNTVTLEQQWPVAANGQIAVAGLQFNDKETWQLGTLVADIDTEDTGIKATLSSDSDYIQLQGIATLGHNGGYQVTADLNISDKLPVVLRTMLAASGKRQANGSIRLSFTGTLPRPVQANNPSKQ